MSCRLCGSRNPVPNHDPNCTQQFELRSPHARVVQTRKVWREQCWCSAVLPSAYLLQPRCPWSCRLRSSQNPNYSPNHKCNCNLVLGVRSPHASVTQMGKVWTERRRCSSLLPWNAFWSPSVPGAVDSVVLGILTLTVTLTPPSDLGSYMCVQDEKVVGGAMLVHWCAPLGMPLAALLSLEL